MPLLTYPWALILLAGAPALAAIYLLRRRFRSLPVSTLMFWERVTRLKEGGCRVRRPLLPLAFFVELLAILLLTAAAVDPRWPVSGGPPLVLVLDDSASMSANSGRDTARDRAGRRAAELIRRYKPASVAAVLAGNRPVAIEMRGAPDAALSAAFDRWKCRAAASCISEAAALACSMAGRSGRVLVLSDHPPPDGFDVGGHVRWVAAGEPLANVGIVQAARACAGDSERCLVEVAAFGAVSNPVRLAVRDAAGRPALERSINLAPGGRDRVVFAAPRGIGSLTVEISPDALSADNRALLMPALDRRVRVEIGVTDPICRSLIERAVKAAALAEPAGAEPELVFSDGPDPASDRPEVWLVRVESGPGLAAFTGPFVIDRGHPLGVGLDLDGVVWAVAQTNASPGMPVIMAGSIPLVADELLPSGRRRLFLRLAPDSSNIQQTPGWPALVWNLLDWRASELPGARAPNIRLGAKAEVTVLPGIRNAAVTDPDGVIHYRPVAAGRLTVETESPGLYTVRAGADEYKVACNMLSASESDLSKCAAGEFGAWDSPSVEAWGWWSGGWLFLLLAVGALVAHMALLRRTGAV